MIDVSTFNRDMWRGVNFQKITAGKSKVENVKWEVGSGVRKVVSGKWKVAYGKVT